MAIFRPTRRSLLPRRPGWTDNLLNWFWLACTSKSLVAVAYFLPGRAKNLSAPRYRWNIYNFQCKVKHRLWTLPTEIDGLLVIFFGFCFPVSILQLHWHETVLYLNVKATIWDRQQTVIIFQKRLDKQLLFERRHLWRACARWGTRRSIVV